MTSFRLQAQGGSKRTIGPDSPIVTIGRSPESDWVILDNSLSRHHARFEWSPQGLFIEDQGSSNGTSLNGIAIQERVALKPGDAVLLGNVRVEVADLAHPMVLIDPRVAPDLGLSTFAVPAARLHSTESIGPEQAPGSRALTVIHELTLGLIREVSTQELLETLLDKLSMHLQADRGVVLLKDADGRLQPTAVRAKATRSSHREIVLSKTLLEAALERREAILLTDPLGDPSLASRSLILSGVTTAIVTPLEAEGQVVGLLYLDARSVLKQFTREDLQLATTLAHIAAAKIETARLMEEAQQTRTLAHEMAIARDIQLRMLPKHCPEDAPFELYAKLRAAREVGGDLYDYQWRNGRLCFCIGDVSGKGMPAALVMALTKTLFRANGAFLEAPSKLMAAVNAQLYEETGPSIFVSAFCGFFDPADGRLVYSNAGHEPPLILAPAQPPRLLQTQRSLALGILPSFSYQDEEITLQARESLLLYTDGVTEALNPTLELYGLSRLQSELAHPPDDAPRAVVRQVLAAVGRFSAGTPQADDLTLFCLRRRQEGGETAPG